MQFCDANQELHTDISTANGTRNVDTVIVVTGAAQYHLRSLETIKWNGVNQSV